MLLKYKCHLDITNVLLIIIHLQVFSKKGGG